MQVNHYKSIIIIDRECFDDLISMRIIYYYAMGMFCIILSTSVKGKDGGWLMQIP